MISHSEQSIVSAEQEARMDVSVNMLILRENSGQRMRHQLLNFNLFVPSKPCVFCHVFFSCLFFSLLCILLVRVRECYSDEVL